MAWCNNSGDSRLNVRRETVTAIASYFVSMAEGRGVTFLAVLPDGGVVWGPDRRGSLMARILSGEQPAEVIGGYTRAATIAQVVEDLSMSQHLQQRAA